MFEAQVIAIAVLGLGSFLAGVVALKLSVSVRRSPMLLSLILCLGGGVILATSLVHMLPEVRDKLGGFAELYFCSGFFVLYLVDEITHYFLGDGAVPVHKKKLNQDHHIVTGKKISKPTRYGAIPKLLHHSKGGVLQPATGPNSSYDYSLADGGQMYEIVPRQSLHLSDYDRLKHEDIGPSKATNCCRKHSLDKWNNTVINLKRYNTDYEEIPSSYAEVRSDTEEELQHVEPHSHCHHHESQSACHVELGEPCATNIVGISGLLVALLLHSILEGVSIGIQTDYNEVLLVLGAVSSHKLVLAYCLGAELVSAGYETYNYLAAIILFSVGSPLGIGIGMSIVSPTVNSLNVVPPLQAIAGGSLLYVAAFEVLPRERFKWQHKKKFKLAGILQMLSVGLGFAFIVFLDTYLMSPHSHLPELPDSVNITSTEFSLLAT